MPDIYAEALTQNEDVLGQVIDKLKCLECGEFISIEAPTPDPASNCAGIAGHCSGCNALWELQILNQEG